jgi:hypothetical protein
LGSRCPPVGPCQDSCCNSKGQASGPGCSHLGRRYRCRRCLLKGCERWFRPCRPQARYCSVDCRAAARRWRNWYASRRYRGSAQGQERRREQSRRYRHQQRELRQALQLARNVPAPPREGQRPAENWQKSGEVPCQRPGCYILFLLTSRSPQQHFCSSACRKALRRVRQREACRCARLRRSQRRGRRPSRGPP